MKFMLMMNTPRDGYTQYMSWSKEVLEANIAFMIGFSKKLSAAGELVATEGLASPLQAKLARAGKDGKPSAAERSPVKVPLLSSRQLR